jgi:hypothetical protein
LTTYPDRRHSLFALGRAELEPLPLPSLQSFYRCRSAPLLAVADEHGLPTEGVWRRATQHPDYRYCLFSLGVGPPGCAGAGAPFSALTAFGHAQYLSALVGSRLPRWRGYLAACPGSRLAKYADSMPGLLPQPPPAFAVLPPQPLRSAADGRRPAPPEGAWRSSTGTPIAVTVSPPSPSRGGLCRLGRRLPRCRRHPALDGLRRTLAAPPAGSRYRMGRDSLVTGSLTSNKTVSATSAAADASSSQLHGLQPLMGLVLDDLCDVVRPALTGLVELSAEMCCVPQRYAPTGYAPTGCSRCSSSSARGAAGQAGRAMVGGHAKLPGAMSTGPVV